MTTTPELRRGHYCYYIPEQDITEYGGYVPALVVEDASGYYPMLGNGIGALPWVWGATKEGAEALAAQQNAKLGLTPERVDEILISSMFPGTRI